MKNASYNYGSTCHTTTVGAVIHDDRIPLPIRFHFEDGKANLVPVVDNPEILLEALAGKG